MMKKKQKTNQSSKSKDDCMNKIVVNKSEVYHISEDLIMEILLRLPPTSVLRFKYVCKSWYSLISTPDFLQTYYSSLQFYKHTTTEDYEEFMVSNYLSNIYPLKYQKKEHTLLKLFFQSSTPPSSFPSEVLDSYPINSCNGLLVLRGKSDSSSSGEDDDTDSSSYGEDDDIYYVDDTYYVYNPITKHCFKIPSISIIRNFIEETVKCMVYLHPPYIWFDPSTSLSYKLIRCLTRITENRKICSEFYVYSSETGSWAVLKRFPFESIHCNPTVMLNGILYWTTCHEAANLICFDLKKESSWLLKLPPKPIGYSSRKCFYFGECDGRLRLIEKYFASDHTIMSLSQCQLTLPCSFDIMETESPQQQQDGNMTWTVKYHVDIETGYDHLIKKHPSTIRIIQLYKTKNKGEEEALLLNIDGKVVPFNLRSNTFGKKVLTRHLLTNSDFNNVFPYITNSVSSVMMIDEPISLP